MAKEKLLEINYKDVYSRVIVGLEDNKKFVDKYKNNKNYLKGLQLAGEKKEHQTVVEYVLPTIMTHLPKILPAYFDLDVEYSTDKEQQSAYLSKMMLKDIYKKQNFYYQYILALLDVLTSGLGWTHQVYRNIYTPEGKIWKRIPIVERVSPVDMIYDRTGYHFEMYVSGCINWLARRIRRPVLEIQADERYNENKKELKGSSIISEEERKDKDLEKAKGSAGLKQAELYEVWLIPERRVITFAKELTADKYLRDMKNPYMSKDKYVIPFALVKGYEIPDEFQARSDADVIEGSQDELNLVRKYMVNYFYRILPTWLFTKGQISEDQKRQLESGDMGMFVEILKAGAVQDLPIPTVPLGALMSYEATIKRDDISIQSGMSEYEMSKMPMVKRTATEALQAQAGGSPRTELKKNFFATFMDRSLNNLLQILQMQMKGQYPITYPVSEMGRRLIRTEYIEKKSIQGNLNVVVDISEQRSAQAQMDRKEKIGGLNMALQIAPDEIDRIAVAKEILRLTSFDNPEIWFPQAEEVEEMEELGGEMPTETPTGMPTEMPTGMEEEVSPVTQQLTEAGAFTKQQRPGFFGGIADLIRSRFRRE